MMLSAVAEKITRAQYARRRGWSRAYVTQLVQAGRVALDEAGLIDPEEADAALAAARDPAASGAAVRPVRRPPPAPPEGRGGPTYMQARTMREAYQAKLAELDYQERAGRSVDRAAIEAEAMALGRELREALLVLPARLGPALAEASDAHECEALLEAALLEALEVLAGGR